MGILRCKRRLNNPNNLYYKLHVSSRRRKYWAQIRDSRHIFITICQSTRCANNLTFHSPNFIVHLAVRHVLRLETWLTAKRYLPNRGAERHLSQHQTCLTATPCQRFGMTGPQKRQNRSLEQPKKQAHFLVIISNKRRAEAIGPTRRIMQTTKDKQIEGKMRIIRHLE